MSPGSLHVLPGWDSAPRTRSTRWGAPAMSQEAGLLHPPAHLQAVLVNTHDRMQLMTRLQQVHACLCMWSGRGTHRGSSSPSGDSAALLDQVLPLLCKCAPFSQAHAGRTCRHRARGPLPGPAGGGQRHLLIFRIPPRVRLGHDSCPRSFPGLLVGAQAQGSPGPLGEHKFPNLGFNFVQRPFVTGQEDTVAVSFPLDVLTPLALLGEETARRTMHRACEWA